MCPLANTHEDFWRTFYIFSFRQPSLSISSQELSSGNRTLYCNTYKPYYSRSIFNTLPKLYPFFFLLLLSFIYTRPEKAVLHMCVCYHAIRKKGCFTRYNSWTLARYEKMGGGGACSVTRAYRLIRFASQGIRLYRLLGDVYVIRKEKTIQLIGSNLVFFSFVFLYYFCCIFIRRHMLAWWRLWSCFFTGFFSNSDTCLLLYD